MMDFFECLLEGFKVEKKKLNTNKSKNLKIQKYVFSFILLFYFLRWCNNSLLVFLFAVNLFQGFYLNRVQLVCLLVRIKNLVPLC